MQLSQTLYAILLSVTGKLSSAWDNATKPAGTNMPKRMWWAGWDYATAPQSLWGRQAEHGR